MMERSILSSARLFPRYLQESSPRAPTATSCLRSASRRQTSEQIRRPAIRCFHRSSSCSYASNPPKSRYRGPKSNEDTQTDFAALDVLRNTAIPASAIDACIHDGFALNNQTVISGSGLLIVSGEVFRWKPWLQEGAAEKGIGEESMTGRLFNAKRQWEVPESAWGLLELVFPKPDLLIIGTGPRMAPLAPSVRRYLNDLGIRLEIQDTRNAAAQFNLLATERGVGQVAAALIPIGWKERH